MRKTQVSRHRHISVATIISLALLLSACINPFQTAYEESSGGDGNSSPYATLRVSSGGISAATIAPDLAVLKGQISSYTLTLTNVTPGTHDPIVIIDYVEGTPVTGIPVPSDWTLTLQGFNASAELIAEGTPVGGNPVVFPDANPVNVSVALQPLTAGTGELDFTLDWSAAVSPGIQVDAVQVTLYSFANAEGESLILSVGNESLTFTNINVSTTATATVNFATETLTVTDPTLNSGSYRLNVTLLKDDGGFIPYAPVIEAVQIYDNLLSSGTASLVAGDLTSPPAAPTDMVVEITAENTFNLYWIDNSNTETGFRIYEDDGLGTRVQLGADQPAGLTSVAGQSSTFALPVDDFTIEVVAFNQFGESAPLSFTFRLLQAAQFPNFQNSINTNSPLWAAAANPGSVNWGTMIVGGGSAVNLYLDTADISDPNALPAPTLLGAPPYDLTESGPFTPGSTYSWRVETVGDVGNEGRVIYPVETLTIRDGILYVATTGNAGAAGSVLDPLGAIQDAIDLALPAETVSVEAGTYTEAITVNKAGLLLQGVGDTSIISPPVGSGTTVIVSAADVTVRDFLVRIGNLDTRTGINISGANATVENNLVTEDPAAPNGVTIRGISGGAGQGARITGNRIVLANVPGVTMNSRWGINMTGSGESAVNPLVIDSNKISYGDAPGTSNMAIQPQGDHQLITNNVLVQEGTNAGQDFTGVRITVTPLNPRVIHNTIINTNPQRTTYGLQVESGTDIVISNNIIAGIAAQFNTGIQQTGGTIVEANNNLFWDVTSTAGALGATADLLNSLQAFATGNVEGDPLLDDVAAIETNNWFAPTSVSLIPEGDTSYLALVNGDILGTTRTRPTIGAYETALPLTLVAHWPFSDGIELNDASVYGNALAQSGDQIEPVYSEDPVGNFYSAIVQTVEGYTVAPSLATGSSSLGQTVSFWYRGTGPIGNFQQQGTIIRRDRGDGSPVLRIGAADADTLRIAVNGVAQLANDLTFPGQMNEGVWNHIVVVFDYAGGEILVYQDGIPQNTSPVSGTSFDNMTNPGSTYIGRYPNGVTQADNAVPGDLDDVRIFNYALSTVDVQNLFIAGR